MQDLINTVSLTRGTDELHSPDALQSWMRGRGLAGGELGEADLAQVHEWRTALREVCLAHAGVEVPATTLQRLGALQECGPLRLEITADGSARVRPHHGLTGAPGLIAATAAAIAQAAGEGSWHRLKACASQTCRWVYYDRSPAGRGRWCTMAVCGSRAKMRTYRRNKATRSPRQ